MSDAGVVQAFFYPSSGTTAPIGTVTQNTPGEPGAAEAGDRFGASVFVGGISDLYYAGTTDFGFENIAVGVPGEDVGGNSDQGVVDVFALLPRQGSPSVWPRSWVYFQGSPSGHVAGTAAAGDDFGAGLTGMPVDGRDRFSSDFGGTRLNVAVPGKDVAGAVDSGEVVTTWISPAPNTATVVDSAGPVAHERYGTGAANTIGGGVAYAFD
jgi:hypothetical protein